MRIAIFGDNNGSWTNFKRLMQKELTRLGIQSKASIAIYNSAESLVNDHQKEHYDACLLSVDKQYRDILSVADGLKHVNDDTIIYLVTTRFKFPRIPSGEYRRFLNVAERLPDMCHAIAFEYRRIIRIPVFRVQTGAFLYNIKYTDIIYFKKSGDKTALITKSKTYPVQNDFTEVVTMMADQPRFNLLLNTHLVNSDNITRFDHKNNTVILANNTAIQLNNANFLRLANKFNMYYAEEYLP